MLNVGELVAKIRVDGEGAKLALKEFKNDVNGTAGQMKDKFKNLGSHLASSINAWAGRMVKLQAAAVAGAVTYATKAYSDYEQLKGGVEKLFGDASDAVMKNAQAAYKTAGMSANQYMEQATSFSASLLQATKGNAQEAAKVTDMAMQDMSDNVNVFGSNMADVQNAYQGFAKQNYTMLDNLKLGYGGTKTEMERLLADAGKLAGKKYDISNLKDVYEAIHQIQLKQNITGTTAKEASKTVEGSFNSMKAAWTNLMTSLGTGDDKLIKQKAKEFGEAFEIMLENVLPVIKETASNLGKALFSSISESFGKGKAMLIASLVGLPAIIKGIGLGKSFKEFFDVTKEVDGVTKNVNVLGSLFKFLGKSFSALAFTPAGAITAMTGFGAAVLLANKNGSEFHQTLTKLKDANRENVAATEANYDSAQRSISILEQLNEVESLSANQKGRVREEVDRLNSIYPGLNLTIDEQTGKVQQNTDKIRENTEALRENAEAEAFAKNATESWNTYYDQIDKAEEKVKEYNDSYKEAMADGVLDDKENQILANKWAAMGDAIKNSYETSMEAVKWSNKSVQEDTEKLLSKIKKDGQKVPESLTDGIKSGKYKAPVTEKEYKKLFKWDAATKGAKGAGKDVVDGLNNSLRSGNIDYKTALKMNNMTKDLDGVGKKAVAGLIASFNSGEINKTELIKGLEKVTGKKWTVKVKGDNKDAKRKINEVNNKPVKNKTQHTKGNNKDAKHKVDEVNAKKVKDKTTTINAKDNASSKIQNIINALSAIPTSVSTTITQITKKVNKGSHATGLDFVPYDEYPANLHYGEMILSRGEANRYRKMQAVAGAGFGGGTTIHVNMSVNGAESPEEWGVRFIDEVKRQSRMGGI